MSVHFCKECGKAHRPKCDQCGSTRDLRSYHGPCGKCAFKKESAARLSILSFVDELEKISNAGMLSNAGAWAGKHLSGIGHNVGQTLASFATPRASLKAGWDATVRPGGKPIGPWSKAFLGMGLYADARQVMAKDDPMGQGRSRLHRAASAVGGQLGGIMAAPYGLSGAILGSTLGSVAGNRAGQMVDRVRGYRPPGVPAQPPHLPPPPVGAQQG